MLKTFAHVKWFQEPVSQGLRSASVGEWAVIAAFISLSLGILVWLKRLLRPYEAVIDKRLARYGSYVPTAVGVTAGTGLILIACGGGFLAPNLEDIPELFLILQAAIGVALVIGLGTRYAAWLLLGLFGIAMFYLGTLALGEQLEYVGIALYLSIMGRGRFALGNLISRSKPPSAKQRKKALQLLLTFTGVALIWLAFSEKLLDINLAQAFLNNGHHWNFLSPFGASERFFILFIGSFELLFGLMIALNLLPRLAGTIVVLAMSTTAYLLGPTEVPGHLFILGFAAAVWVNDTGKYGKKAS